MSPRRLILLFLVEFALTALAIAVFPILSQRILTIHGTHDLFYFSMPWLLLFFIPHLVFMIDWALIMAFRGSLFVCAFARHGFYLFIMIGEFMLFFRFMTVTITRAVL